MNSNSRLSIDKQKASLRRPISAEKQNIVTPYYLLV